MTPANNLEFLSQLHPYDQLPNDVRSAIADAAETVGFSAGSTVYELGESLDGLYIILTGSVEVTDQNGDLVSLLETGNSFGERGLMRDGRAATSAFAKSDATLLLLPAPVFTDLVTGYDQIRRYFDRRRPTVSKRAAGIETKLVADLMADNPASCSPDTSIQQAAETMKQRGISCLIVADGDHMRGIVTTRDMNNRVVVTGHDAAGPVSDIMTENPLTLPPSALGSDVLHMMLEHRVGHIPITVEGRAVGIITQTDLTRFQAIASAELVHAIARAASADEMAKITARIPQMLLHLVQAGNRHDVVTRLITDIADACTRRLLALAEAKFGPPPVPYLWLACGSQGRQEQTGVTDQDNCLFLDDAATDSDMTYFCQFAEFVCAGLDACGYVFCPGDMMATNPQWCQPVHVWKEYFNRWIEAPDNMAQMLASVMFDLRPIGGEPSLFKDLNAAVLERASKNSIFVVHMAANARKHAPPLGLLRGIVTIRSGEHKDQVDLKHQGVVPLVDLARIYALRGRIEPVNTRQRLVVAAKNGVISESGARDLLDAYDLIAQTRLEHQAAQVHAEEAPDNFLSPDDLSDFERSHLRDAFVVVRTMQSALGHGLSAAI